MKKIVAVFLVLMFVGEGLCFAADSRNRAVIYSSGYGNSNRHGGYGQSYGGYGFGSGLYGKNMSFGIGGSRGFIGGSYSEPFYGSGGYGPGDVAAMQMQLQTTQLQMQLQLHQSAQELLRLRLEIGGNTMAAMAGSGRYTSEEIQRVGAQVLGEAIREQDLRVTREYALPLPAPVRIPMIGRPTTGTFPVALPPVVPMSLVPPASVMLTTATATGRP